MATTVSLKFLFQSAGLGKTMKQMQNAFKQVNNEVKRINKEFDTLRKSSKTLEDIRRKAGAAARQMNNLLGGKKVQGFAQNLTSIGNRLGFMAFQWNFMANAANRALDMVLGGMQRIITEGSLMSDAVVRAMAFSTSASGILNMTPEARQDLERMRDLIEGFSSGQTIFGPDAVSNIAGQLQKAADDLNATETILPFALKIKTIEPGISDEKIATGAITLLESLNVAKNDVKEVAKAFDFLANVSDKTTGNFQSTIASLSRALPLAKAIGSTATETGLGLSIGFDILGRNVSGGRAGQSAGRIFESFLGEMLEAGDKASKSRQFLDANDIFPFDEVTGKLRPIIDILSEFRDRLGSLDEEARAGFLEKAGLSKQSQLFILGGIQKSNEELEKFRESLQERGTLLARSLLIEGTGQSQILRIQSAFSALQRTLADGFSPALKEAADLLTGIASDREIKIFLAEIGFFIAEDIIPHLRTAIKIFRQFFKQLKNEKGTIKLLAKSIVILVAALGALSIISSIGFFALVAAGSLFALTGQALTAAGAMGALGVGVRFAFKWLLPVFVTMIGIALAGREISEALEGKEGANPALAALGIAMAGLGLGALALGFKNAAIEGKGLAGIIGNIFKGTPGGGFVLPASGLFSKIIPLLTNPVTLIAAAAIAGALVGNAIGEAMRGEAGKRGYKTAFDMMVFDFKFALLDIIQNAHKLPELMGSAWQGILDGWNAWLIKANLGWIQFLDDVKNAKWDEVWKAMTDSFFKAMRIMFPALAALHDFATGKFGNINFDFILNPEQARRDTALDALRNVIENIVSQRPEQFTDPNNPAALANFPQIQAIIEQSEGLVNFMDVASILRDVMISSGESFQISNEEFANIIEEIGKIEFESGKAAAKVAKEKAKQELGLIGINESIKAEQVAINGVINESGILSKETGILHNDVVENQFRTKILSGIEGVTSDRYESFIKSLVAGQFAMDALTSGFLVTNLEMSKLKTAATELKRLYDSVTIDSEGKVHSTRFGTGDNPSTAADKENQANAQNNIETITDFLGGIGSVSMGEIGEIIENAKESVKSAETFPSVNQGIFDLPGKFVPDPNNPNKGQFIIDADVSIIIEDGGGKSKEEIAEAVEEAILEKVPFSLAQAKVIQ